MEKTYAQWRAEGRAIQEGAKAVAFLVPPDFPENRAGIPLFEEHQTILPDDLDTDAWHRLDREDYYALRKPAAKKPTVRLEYNHETKVLWVWCGPNKEMIRLLRKNHYRFDLAKHRWRKQVNDPAAVAQILADTDQYEIAANFEWRA